MISKFVSHDKEINPNYRKAHYVCHCPSGKKVPIEEREYLRDQRAKRGTKGAFQMAGTDFVAASSMAAKEARQQREQMQEQRGAAMQHLSEVTVNVSFGSDVSMFEYSRRRFLDRKTNNF
jgi:hypothetical protein